MTKKRMQHPVTVANKGLGWDSLGKNGNDSGGDCYWEQSGTNKKSTLILRSFPIYLKPNSQLPIYRQGKFQGPLKVGPPFPYYSHTIPIRIPWSMGMVWEAYGKGVPLLGVPEKILYIR